MTIDAPGSSVNFAACGRVACDRRIGQARGGHVLLALDAVGPHGPEIRLRPRGPHFLNFRSEGLRASKDETRPPQACGSRFYRVSVQAHELQRLDAQR